MELDAIAKESIIKWIDTQITFNPYSISQNETIEFFKSWQQHYFPDHPYVEIHSTLHPNACHYSWSIYLCTSSERFKQFGKTLFEPNTMLSVLWADFILRKKKHIIEIKILADTVQNIVVSVE